MAMAWRRWGVRRQPRPAGSLLAFAFTPALCALLASSSAAQPQHTPLGRNPTHNPSVRMFVDAFSSLRPVDQFIADADLLASSLRVTFADPRRPADFAQVYRAPGLDDRYVRVDGGLVAAFPRSVYAAGRDGVVPLIPPGTVFYIGALPPGARQADPAIGLSPASADRRIDARLPDSFIGAALASDADDAPRLARAATRVGRRFTVWSDEAYRQRRIESLLHQAGDDLR